MEPRSTAISASPASSAGTPTSATRAPHGKKAASKTPSAGCAATSPEKPTSTTCQPKPSTPSSQTTTTLPENASASELQPKPSYRCTSNVNPHPDQVRGDELFGVNRGRSEEHTSELQSLMRISYAVFCLK